MKRHELIVIGAGPAGLSAAIEAKKNGMDVIVFDENQRPGGQLFKQIHKLRTACVADSQAPLYHRDRSLPGSNDCACGGLQQFITDNQRLVGEMLWLPPFLPTLV